MNTTIQYTAKYKNSPLGLIPEDWDVKEFNQIGVNVIDGDRGKNYPSENEFTSSGYCVFLNAKNVTNQGFAFIDINFISEEKDKELRKGKLIKQDIVLTTRGTVGNVSFFDESVKYENLRINSGMVLIRNTKMELLENNFLHKCFTSYVLQQQIDKVSFGSAQPQLTVKEINKFKLPIPPLQEQKAIADCLSTWDKAIEKQSALITQKELSKKALAQKLLTGKLRIKGFENEKWVELKADKIFRNNTDKSHNGKLEILSASQERGILPRRLNNIDIKYDESSLGSYKKVEIGDYVISLRSFQGGIEYSEYEGIVSPAYTIIKEIVPISKVFYKVYFKTETFINRLNTIIYGIRDGKQISFSDFATLKLPYPTIEEQTAIANVLQCADDELQLLKKKLDQLKEQKKGLMQVLLTGKRRLMY